MAAAAIAYSQDDARNGKASGRDTPSPGDKQILEETYAEALSMMGFKDDIIILAVKLVREDRAPLTVENLLMKADELVQLKEKGEPIPEVKNKRSLPKSLPNQKYNSDGESDSSEEESMEFCDASSSLPERRGKHDLQEDCEQRTPTSKMVVPMELEPVAKKGDQTPTSEVVVPVGLEPMAKKGDQTPTSAGRQQQNSFLQQKLRALRYENRKLKERQLCRNCQDKSVSITFLPCGHYSYCYDCGQKFTACPICRKTILADVKTFLA